MLLMAMLQKCVPSKTKDINVKVLNMITRIDEGKTLLKHISCDSKCKFDCRTGNSNQKCSNDECQCECKKYCKIIVVEILAHEFIKLVYKKYYWWLFNCV